MDNILTNRSTLTFRDDFFFLALTLVISSSALQYNRYSCIKNDRSNQFKKLFKSCIIT